MTRDDRVEIALDVLGDRAVRDRRLDEFTTYRLGGPAAIFATMRTSDDLEAVVRAVRESGLPVLVLGRGSNLLVSDEGFPGLVIHLAEEFEQILIDPQGEVRAGGAVALPVLARRTAAAGLVGFEWAVGVPGSVGGAVRMNAGGHGSDMAATLVGAEVLDLSTGECAMRRVEDLGLRFRGSALSVMEVVLGVEMRLVPGDATEAGRRITEIVAWRRAHQPGGQNCGSVFVNPIPGEVAAAELIDRCGLRGLRHGGAIVSPKHANFIQAEPGARAVDVRQLIELIRERVAAETGFVLRSEVLLVGFEERL